MDTQKSAVSLRVVLQLAFFLFVVPLLPILVSGRWNWWEAWTYAAVNVLGFVVSRVLAARRHPDIIAERARSMQMENAKPWDKILAPLLSLGLMLALIAAGLDSLYSWTPPFSLAAKLTALLVIVLGFAFGSWALIENRFFSGVVRIQADRGQHVVDTGPYRFVRHPGYAGAVLSYLLTPVFLNSWWAFIPVVFTLIVLVIRTALEDKTLQEELPGYKEFAQKTRYRLIPGIW